MSVSVSVESPAMEQSAAANDGTQPDVDGQNDTASSNEGNASQAKSQPKGGLPVAEKAETLRKMLKREKEDPNVQFSDAELDIYDEYAAGKLKPAKARKGAPKAVTAPVDEEAAEPAEPEETPASEPKDEPEAEEVDETEDSGDDDEESEQSDPEAEALLKEVGAKSMKEALAKIKELRQKVGGRDSQQVAKLEKQLRDAHGAEKRLWEDVAKGVPEALAHAERVYGVKLGQQQQQQQQQQSAHASAAQQQAQQQRTDASTDDFQFVDEKEALDEASARIYNASLRKLKSEIDSIKSVAGEFAAEKDRNRKEAANQSAQGAVVDEMVEVAQGLEGLKGLPNLREAIDAWYKGKSDARMNTFNELFDIAMAEGTNLKAAAHIKRGRDADKLIAEAEQRGRKAAYGHKPNPSLSGQQGGKGEKTTYQNLSDAQIEAMSEDHRLIPDDWYDAKDNPVQNKIPKRAWKIFGFA